MLCNRNTESGAPGLKPEAAANCEAEVVAEESVCTNGAIAREHGPGVLHQTVADVHAHERTAGGPHIHAAADIDCKQRVA